MKAVPSGNLPIRSPAALRWGVALAVFGLIERAVLWLIYRPIYYGDTGAYQRLTEVLSQGSLQGYDGTRVPFYPAFLAVVGPDGDAIWLAQMVLGWGISLLLFWMTWRVTASPAWAASVGFLYNLIPGQVLFEANLLTETLTAFLLVLSYTVLLALQRSRPMAGQVAIAFGLGVLAALAGLTRPLFFLFAPWLLPFVWIGGDERLPEDRRPLSDRLRWLLAGPRWRARLARSAAYCVGPLLLLGGWLAYIQTTYQMLAPTVMTGYNWVQHTGGYFEYLPDEDAAIRDTYIRYRDQRIAERGDQTNAIWDAIPELTQASGLSFFNLSEELQRLSLRLIRAHPDLYLKNVIEGWISFWKAPPYWRAESLRLPWTVGWMQALVLMGRGISIAANGLFLLITAAALLSVKARRRLAWDRYLTAIAGMIWLTSIVQTLVDHGDNERFLVPLQMLVILTVARAAAAWLRRGGAPSG